MDTFRLYSNIREKFPNLSTFWHNLSFKSIGAPRLIFAISPEANNSTVPFPATSRTLVEDLGPSFI